MIVPSPATGNATARKTGPATPPDRATRNRAISRGWDYAPGRTVAERIREHTREKIGQLPGRLGQLLLEDMRNATERDVDPTIFGAGS